MNNWKTLFKNQLLLWLLSILFLSAAAPGQYKHVDDKGKFKAKFPAEIQINESESNGLVTTKVSCETGRHSFLISYTIHNVTLEDAENLSQVSLDAFSNALNGEIIESENWHYKGNTGKEALIHMKELEARVDYRVLIRGQIQYQLVVTAAHQDYDEKLAKKFFKSFKLLK